MDANLAAVSLAGCIGLAIGGSAAFSFRLSQRRMRLAGTSRASGVEPAAPVVPADAAAVLSVLRSSAVVLGPGDEVVSASAPARALGIVAGAQLLPPELLELVHQVRRDQAIRSVDLELADPNRVRGRVPAQTRYVATRVAPLSVQLVLVLVEERTTSATPRPWTCTSSGCEQRSRTTRRHRCTW